MRKVISFFTNRVVIVGIMFLLQIALIVWLFLSVPFTYEIHLISTFLGVIISLYLISTDENPMFKLIWIILILVLPIFGVIFYLYSRTESLSGSTSSRMREYQGLREKELKKIESHKVDEHIKQQVFLEKNFFPVYKNTESTFIPSGIEKQKLLIEELKKAKHFIFMEYFIITKSKMWSEILNVLIDKKNEGVEVRIMYDDFGSATKLPYNYHKELQRYGFKVVRFNPMRLHIKFSMNYRDHRKIVVIDNQTAFTGGINIGDEYTNKKKVFGHWNDAAIMIKGEAVWSFTVMFLENWGFSVKEKPEFRKYNLEIKQKVNNKSRYAPFADIPSDNKLTSKNIYLHLINDASKSIIITAPYLIIDNEIATALKLAAMSGVDVKIVVPNIPDKKLIYIVSEAYIEELVTYGVKIYKYMPGFIHSKMIICDSEVAMIGTSNLDFRSLYMHLENNLWLNDKNAINDINLYIENTLQKCRLIRLNDLKKKNIFYKILQAVLKGFSPLL